MELNQWLMMNGYGIYVWPAYGITFTVFFINLLMPLIEKHFIKKNMAKENEP